MVPQTTRHGGGGLTLTRMIGEEIHIGGGITVRVVSIKGRSGVRLNVKAPPELAINRGLRDLPLALDLAGTSK